MCWPAITFHHGQFRWHFGSGCQSLTGLAVPTLGQLLSDVSGEPFEG